MQGSGIASIPAFGRWLIVLSTPELVEELAKIPDNVMSLSESLSEVGILPYLSVSRH